jgi:ABC-type nitrate/sulfonate/bicarbonate transport system permease component
MSASSTLTRAVDEGLPASTRPPLELPAVDVGALGRFRRRFGYAVLITVEAILFLALWEFLTGMSGLVNPVFLPPPSKVVAALVDLFTSGEVWPHLRFSATTWSIGYGLAALVGVGVGLLMGAFQPVGRLLGPLAWSLYATPHISIRPMLVIWFGFGAAPIIALVFVSAIFPILLTTAAGVRTVDPTLLRAGEVFGGRWVDLQRKIVLPATLPFVVTGLRLAIPTSLIGMLVGEILGSGQGLGAILALGTATFRVDQAIAALVILVTTSLALLRLFSIIEAKIAPWRSDGAA